MSSKILALAADSCRTQPLVAVSGIDGSGKGYVTARLVAALKARGGRAAGINIDGWLPSRRPLRSTNPAEHFYLRSASTTCSKLVLPLRDHRSVRVEVDFAEGRPRRSVGNATSCRTSTSSCWKGSTS
jgi:hypothetical protein